MALSVALGIYATGLAAPSQAQPQDQAAPPPQAALPSQTEVQTQTLKPLTRMQVDDLVASGLDSESLAKVVHERGIDFQPTDRYLETLRSQGAMQTLIDALRTATPDPLSKAQLLKSLAAGTPQDDLVSMVERRGVDFKPSPEDIDTLRIAGAEDPLCQAVQRAKQGRPSAANNDTSAGRVYDVGEDVTAPIPIYHPDPPLTAQARKAKVAPVANLFITIGRDGDVQDVRLAKGLGLGLDKKAVDTVKTWKFRPGMHDGSPVPVRMKMAVSFAANVQSVPLPE
jgi:TonB family protein